VTNVRVIGIGSPAGDDQAGWLVVDALQRLDLTERLPCALRIVALDRPSAQLIHEFEDADVVVLVDATRTGARPGTVHRIARSECFEVDRSLSGHQLGVASALELADALELLPADLRIYGIEMQSAMANCGPSHCVASAACELAQIIADELLQRFGAPAASDAAG